MHDSKSGGVGGQPNEAKGRIYRGIREADAEWGVTGESVDGEFTTSKVLSGSEEGDIAVNRAVRGLDEELGELMVPGTFLFGVVRESDVDGDRRVLSLEN